MTQATDYRTNADGSVVCRHRDMSCCADCLAADERLIDVMGAVFLVDDADVRAALQAEVDAAERRGGLHVVGGRS